MRGNIHDQRSGAGFLTQREEAYLACLELGHVKLEEMFRQDEQRWTKNFELTKRRAGVIKEQVETLLKK